MDTYDSLENPKYDPAVLTSNQYYVIHDLSINETDLSKSAVLRTTAKQNVGLFESFEGTNHKSIKNVTFDKAEVTGPVSATADVAALVGKFEGKIIDNIKMDEVELKAENNTTGNVGVVAGEFIGANVSNLEIDNVTLDASVDGTGTIGGLIGKFTQTDVQGITLPENVSPGISKAKVGTKEGSQIKITATGAGSGTIGGIVGEFSGDTISEINVVQPEAGSTTVTTGNTFEITGTTNPDSIVGGIAGTIKRSSAGNTTLEKIYVKKPQLKTENNDTVGGAVGKIFKENIGTISIDEVEITDPLIKASYIAKVGGLVGISEPQLTVQKSNVKVTATDTNNTWENATVGIMTKPQ